MVDGVAMDFSSVVPVSAYAEDVAVFDDDLKGIVAVEPAVTTVDVDTGAIAQQNAFSCLISCNFLLIIRFKVQHACRCAPPATATSSFHGRSGYSETVRSLSLYMCVESVADRTETHAVVDNNIQVLSKDISVQLSTLLPLTIKSAIGLIVGGALQMQLLLLLLLQCISKFSS